MNKALLTFSNGKILELYEGQRINTIYKQNINGEISTSQGPTYELWCHASDGMLPSVTELLCKCVFFYTMYDTNKIYASASVVTVENI